MRTAICAGDLLVATPRPHSLSGDVFIVARLPGQGRGWTIRIPRNSLLLAAAPAAAIDKAVRVLHNDQLLDVRLCDVEPAKVT